MSYTTTLGFTPAFKITRDGEDITARLSDRAISVRVSLYQGGGDADSLDIGLDDRGWEIDIPNIGESSTTIDIAMGYAESGLYALGSFSVDEVNLSFPPKAMTIHGNSVGSNTALKAPLITSFDGKTVSDVVSAIAGAAELSPVVDAAIGSIQIPFLNQHAGSGHLLQDLERQFNGLAKSSDGKLSFTQRGSGNNASGNSIGTVTLDGTEISDLHTKLINSGSFSHTKASWWDKEQHKLQYVTSSLTSAASKVPFLIKRSYNSQGEAQAAADSQQASLNRKGVTGSLTMAKGDASIKAGSTLVITGTRDGIDGTYIVESVTHSFTKDSGITSVLNFFSEDGLGSDTGGGDTQSDTGVAGADGNNNAPL